MNWDDIEPMLFRRWHHQAGEAVHPLRQLYRDLLSTRLSPIVLVILPVLLLIVFIGTRTAVRLLYKAADVVRTVLQRRRGVISYANFHKKEFWEQEYTRATGTFEWYASFNEVRDIVLQWLPAKPRVLYVGCGTSDFGRRLYAEGVTRITCTDISGQALALAADKARRSGCPNMRFLEADACNMKPCIPDATYNFAIDKGTLDALSCSPDAGYRNCKAMLDEVWRVLRPNGMFVLITALKSSTIDSVRRMASKAPFDTVQVHHMMTRRMLQRTGPVPYLIYVLRKPDSASPADTT